MSSRPWKIAFLVILILLSALTLYSAMTNKMAARLGAAITSLMSLGYTHAAQCQRVNSQSIDLSWHPPKHTAINDLAAVINATGVSGYIFNSSVTPSGVPYGTYNWCNMPHVRPQEYPRSPAGYKLEYVEIVSLPIQNSPVHPSLIRVDPSPS